MAKWILHFDGLCEPRNPGGHMVWAWVISTDAGELIASGSEFIAARPENTNNVAEYYAIGFGLRALLDRVTPQTCPDEIIVRGDSKLVVNQVNGSWQCNKKHLEALRDRARHLLGAVRHQLKDGATCTLEWVARDQNEIADEIGRATYIKNVGHAPPERNRKAS